MEHLSEMKNTETCFKTDGQAVEAVDGASLYLDPDEVIGIVGESGSGKSVTMMSMLRPISSSGKITGREVYTQGKEQNMLELGADSEKVRHMGGGKVSMIFQEPMTSLDPVLTAGYQIRESIIEHPKMSKEDAEGRIIRIFKPVNILDAEQRSDYYPQQLSGGMRQRAMIATAMPSEPTVLAADEATTALDATAQAQLSEMIRDITKKMNTTIIIITHNLGTVTRSAEWIYVMYSGGMVEMTDARRLFISPEHPYTRVFLRATSKLDDPKGRTLVPIEGLPPNPATRPSYCSSYERCEYRMDRCKEYAKPGPKELEKEYFAVCRLTEEEEIVKAKEIMSKEARGALKIFTRDELYLSTKNVRKHFPVYSGMMRKKTEEVRAIEDINFYIKRGETLGIVGKSGCGKMTLTRCIMRVYKPGEGETIFNDTDIADFNDRQMYLFRRKISMIFQGPFSSLDLRQTTESIVGESLPLYKLVKNKAEYSAKVNELLHTVGLDSALEYRAPHGFSGGQRQRIGIVKALSLESDMITYDEPVFTSDVFIQAQIINLLEELQSQLGLTYLFIAHGLATVEHTSNRILVMYLGRVVGIAGCDELYDNTLHPYIKTLLSTVPVADPAVEEFRGCIPIRSEVPSLTKRPEGRPFHDRCPHVRDGYRREVPVLRDVGKGHEVACLLYEQQFNK